MAILYNVGTNLARACFTAFARWEVEGKEAVPPKGPLIVVSNHISNADPPVLVSSFPRMLHFLAKEGLYRCPVVSSFLTAVGTHPVKREGLNIGAVRWNLDILRREQAIVLFPEGTRGRGGGMVRGKPGVAYIHAKSGAPVLPVAISGTEKIPGYWRIAFPLCHIKVRIGEPFSLPVMEGKLSRPVLEHMADIITQRIADLLPLEYRGYYSEKKVESGSQL